jgi:hypothetical protein
LTAKLVKLDIDRSLSMAKPEQDITHTTFSGRTITDVNALLRDPKVQETIKKLGNDRDPVRRPGGVTFLRRRKSE